MGTESRSTFNISLIYFKASGKFYTEARFEWSGLTNESGSCYMPEVVDHVRNLRDSGTPGVLPGLSGQTKGWDGPIFINCEEGYPCLLLPRDKADQALSPEPAADAAGAPAREWLVRVGYRYDSRPCDEAEMLDYLRLDERTADNPAKIEHYKGETAWWYNEGQNHRLSPQGRIQRDIPDRAWFVRITSVEQLLRLMSLYGWRLDRDSWRDGTEWQFTEV